MHRQSRELEPSEGVNITPMLDVVFILLIFFIVTTSFVRETGVSLQRGHGSNQPTNPGTSAVIRLDSQQGYTLNGQSVTVEGLNARLQQLKASRPDLQVDIFATGDVLTGDLVAVIDQVNRSGIRDYRVASQ